MPACIGGLGMSDLVAGSKVEPSSQTVSQTVSRAIKGDRLPLHPNAVTRYLKTNTPRATASDFKLPTGCEAPVSLLANFELARMAGRCLS